MLPGGGVTTCVSTAEVLPLKAASPPYVAVMECGPTERAEAVSDAVPAALSAPVPSSVAPSKNATCPVGVPLAPLTVAVKVTA